MPIDDKINELKRRYDFNDHFFVYVYTKEDALNFLNLHKKIYPNSNIEIITYTINNFNFSGGEIFTFEIRKNKNLTDRPFCQSVIDNNEHIFIEYPKNKLGIYRIFGYNPSPSYTPKRIERTLENYEHINEGYFSNNYDLDNVNILYKPIFKIGDKVKIRLNAMIIVQKNNSHKFTLISENINFINNNIGKVFEIRQKFKHTLESDRYPWWSKLNGESGSYLPDMILEKHNIVPSYTPKRIERTLESVATIYNKDTIKKKFKNSKYSAIVVRIKNREDKKIFFNIINDYLVFPYYLKREYKVNRDYIIFLNNDNDRIPVHFTTFDYYDDGDFIIDYPDTYPKLITPYELNDILIDILGLSSVKDIYSPKKIERTLNENISPELRLVENRPPDTLSIEEQNKRYKIGDIIYIRKDSFDIYTDIDEHYMKEYLGKMGKIVDITTAKEMYNYGTEFAGEGCGTLNPTDLLLSVKDPENEFSEIWYWWYKCLINPKYVRPTYQPKKITRTLERFNNFNKNDVLYVFDMDDTLVYSDEFEDHIRPLLNENITPEEIFNVEVSKIDTDLSYLKYEHGRIYMDDPNKIIKIPKNSSWVRKKDRIYLTTPESYYMTTESIPNKVNKMLVDLYNSVKDKAIVTARKEKYRYVTELALQSLGIETPNYGLFMYPDETHSFKSKWKSDRLLELYDNDKFNELHYYDDNIKLLKKMKHYLSKYKKNIYLYKVGKDSYRKI